MRYIEAAHCLKIEEDLKKMKDDLKEKRRRPKKEKKDNLKK
jgi:hypothetical protein